MGGSWCLHVVFGILTDLYHNYTVSLSPPHPDQSTHLWCGGKRNLMLMGMAPLQWPRALLIKVLVYIDDASTPYLSGAAEFLQYLT
jgi:hypothetical protein